MEESFSKTSTEDNKLFEVSFGTVPQAFNFAFNKYPDMDYYHLTNDDVVYKTVGWDKTLSNKNTISYGNDLLQGKNMPTFPVIDGNIIRALGWLVMPNFKKYGGDLVWKFLGDNLKILDYHPNVIIQHNWEGADEDINKEDMSIFAQWLPWAFKDLEKIRKIL